MDQIAIHDANDYEYQQDLYSETSSGIPII